MLKEFREFAIKGNVVDLAVAVIIGGAFGKIVTSLVNDLIMPILSVILGGISFTDLKVIIVPAKANITEVSIRYGSFLQSVIDFFIIAFSIFVFIKIISSFKKKEKEIPCVSPAPSNEEILLQEIRDLLKVKCS